LTPELAADKRYSLCCERVMDKRDRLGAGISVAAIALAILHLVFPSLAIDTITVALLVIAVVPWLGPIFKRVELPGGVKVEYQELKEKEAEVARAGLLASTVAHEIAHSFLIIRGEDPNLALAGLRIELEKSLRALAERNGLPTERASVRTLARDLAGKQVISGEAYLALSDLATLLNRAVHGAEVDDRAVDWAMDVGPKLLTTLRTPTSQHNHGR